jgi:hypothetical protein
MPLESGTYISDLNVSNPAAGDAMSQGDDHLRLIKSAIKTTFPNVTGAVNATHTTLNNAYVPIGGIILWSGSIASIPANWALCNGSSGTPNLEGRFIIGGGNTQTPGGLGGSFTSDSQGSHAHTTDAQGAHAHGNVTLQNTLSALSIDSDFGYPGGSHNGLQLAISPQTTGGTASSGHAHTITSDGSHAHTTTADGAHTHTTVPPYYALAYIMRIS